MLHGLAADLSLVHAPGTLVSANQRIEDRARIRQGRVGRPRRSGAKRVHLLDALPLGATGKIDRKALTRMLDENLA